MALLAGDIYPNAEVLPVGGLLALASDELIRRPLWEFRPEQVAEVQHERRWRFRFDEEPIGDPEYS